MLTTENLVSISLPRQAVDSAQQICMTFISASQYSESIVTSAILVSWYLVSRYIVVSSVSPNTTPAAPPIMLRIGTHSLTLRKNTQWHSGYS